MRDNLRHSQYDVNGVQIDDPQKTLPYLGSWGQEAVFSDFTTQTGLLDTPKTVLFGTEGTTPRGIAHVDAEGVLTILKNGPLSSYVKLRISRSGASGVSNIFVWAEVSFDGGTAWVSVGEATSASLDSSADVVTTLEVGFILLPVGAKVRARFARSSTGNNSGDLVPLAASAALTAAGVPDTPSAVLALFSQEGYPYFS